MTIKELIAKLRIKKSKPADEEIQRRLNEKKEQALVKASQLRHLIKDKTGWPEYCGLIQEYIDHCYYEKLNTRIDMADEKLMQRMKLIDREIYILQWVLQIPAQYIEQAEKATKEDGD